MYTVSPATVGDSVSMTRTHIGALEERVRRLSASIEELDQEVERVRIRVTTLERDADPSVVEPNSKQEGPPDVCDSNGSHHTGATPAEVAAAVRSVEAESEADASDECEDILIV